MRAHRWLVSSLVLAGAACGGRTTSRPLVVEPTPAAAEPQTAPPTAEELAPPTVEELAAAERLLLEAETQYEQVFVPFQVMMPAREIEDAKLFKQHLDAITLETQDRYKLLERSRIPAYAAAARVRYGETMWLYAEKMAAMPVPDVIVTLDINNPSAGALEAWRDAIAKNLVPYREKARTAWLEVVAVERELGASRWTSLARTNLARFPATP